MRNHSAGLESRALAMAIDGLLMAAASALLMWITYGQPISRWDDTRPGTLAINWLVPLAACLLFWTWQGATPGKLIAGIKVVDYRSGGRPTLVQALTRWVGYLLSAVPLGAGFWWARVDPDGRAWHDRLSGTAVERSRPLPESGRGLLAEYIVSHWRGEQSLVQSFWINNLLLSFPLMAALTGLMSWISLKGEALQMGSIAMLVGWPLMVVFGIWCVVGCWRAAGTYLDENGSLLWAFLSRLIMFLGALQLIASVVAFAATSDEYWLMARGIDPIGQAELTVSSDRKTLTLNGPIGLGDATRVGELLEATPTVRQFELASPGGRVFEAERIVELVRKQGGNTRAVGDCQSACTLVFLAGQQRQLMPGAQLGFHRASSGTFNPAFDQIANQQLAATYRKMSLPEEFIDKTLSTPSHSMWYPKSEDLVRHALILDPPRTLDIALPSSVSGAPPLGDYVEALRANPTWYQMNQRFPGLIDDAATRMRDARGVLAGTPQEADGVQMAGQMALAPHVRELLLNGTPESRRRYLQVVRAQLTAAQALGRDSCQAWLSGSPVPRRLLPDTVMAWEAGWLLTAAGETPPARAKPAAPSPIEMEVVHRTVGAQAPGLLARLWSEGDSAAPVTCERAAQLLDHIKRVKVAPRELAERIVFQVAG